MSHTTQKRKRPAIRRGIAGALFSAFALAITSVQPAHATPQADNIGNPVSADESIEVTTGKIPQPERELAEFWTPERMRKAVRLAQKGGGLVDDPPPSTHAAKPPQSDGPPTMLAPPQSGSAAQVAPTTLQEAPSVGKVFYWNPTTNRPGVCSASTVNNQTKNMVLTAGHCFFTADDGTQLQQWVFVPGYRNGNAPYGMWHPEYYTVPVLWKKYQVLEYDVILMNMYPNNGTPTNGTEVVEAVGGNGLTINHNFPKVAIWGYPSELPYGGEVQYYCLNRQTYEAPVLRVKAGCAMTRGASGGPWLKNFNTDSRLGIAIGVTSTFAEPEGYIASPYFGGYMEDLYEAAKGL